MELRFQVDDAFINQMMAILEMKEYEVAREALTILHWAVKERLKGRVILSANDDGKDVHRLAMPALEKLSPTD